MTDSECRLFLMELDADAARDLVENGNAEYYIAGERGVGPDLVEVAINATGSVVAVVLIELTKATAKAVASALKRHRRDSGDEVAVCAEMAEGNAEDRVRAIVTIEDDGVALHRVISSYLPPAENRT
jgi:hypothetical protein